MLYSPDENDSERGDMTKILPSIFCGAEFLKVSKILRYSSTHPILLEIEMSTQQTIISSCGALKSNGDTTTFDTAS